MRALVVMILMSLAATAAAQLRTIPQDAQRGEMRGVMDMAVDIDGERLMLAPGVMIRDQENMIIVPGHLPTAAPVKYRLDPDGQVRFMWLLTPEEAAASQPPSPFPK